MYKDKEKVRIYKIDGKQYKVTSNVVDNPKSIDKLYDILVRYALIKLNDSENRNKRHTRQGGGVAAPVGGQVFSEVLPYLLEEK